jgi:hypothetical protein
MNAVEMTTPPTKATKFVLSPMERLKQLQAKAPKLAGVIFNPETGIIAPIPLKRNR